MHLRAAFAGSHPEALRSLDRGEDRDQTLSDAVALRDLHGLPFLPNVVGVQVFVGPPGRFSHRSGRLVHFAGKPFDELLEIPDQHPFGAQELLHALAVHQWFKVALENHPVETRQ